MPQSARRDATIYLVGLAGLYFFLNHQSSGYSSSSPSLGGDFSKMMITERLNRMVIPKSRYLANVSKVPTMSGASIFETPALNVRHASCATGHSKQLVCIRDTDTTHNSSSAFAQAVQNSHQASHNQTTDVGCIGNPHTESGLKRT